MQGFQSSWEPAWTTRHIIYAPSFYGIIIFHCMDLPHVVDLFIWRQTLRLLFLTLVFPFISHNPWLGHSSLRWQTGRVSHHTTQNEICVLTFPRWFFSHGVIASLRFEGWIIRVTLAHFFICLHLVEGEGACYHQWEKENMAALLSCPFFLGEPCLGERASWDTSSISASSHLSRVFRSFKTQLLP